MKFFKKFVEVPVSNETQLIEAVQLWEVRWSSRWGELSTNVRDEVEAFPSEIEAKHFFDALVNAFALVRHTSGNRVTMKKGVGVKARISAVSTDVAGS